MLSTVKMHNPIISPPLSSSVKPTVVFTTPENYASRLSHLLTLKGHNPLWCPTIITEPTPHTLSSLKVHLSPQSISLLSAIAFPSRTAITAFSSVMTTLQKPFLPPPHGETFILAALGGDAELIDRSFITQFCYINRIELLVPPTSTPSGLVESLGTGRGRKVLCPVPLVIGLDEPPVVSNFIRDLEVAGWVPIRVNAYETRWMGPTSAEGMMRMGRVDAIVFTSSAEVEGLLKSLKEFGCDWGLVRRRWPCLVVAAHGPVTAAGAARSGVDVDVVSSKFSSFQGVVDALDLRLQGLDL